MGVGGYFFISHLVIGFHEVFSVILMIVFVLVDGFHTSMRLSVGLSGLRLPRRRSTILVAYRHPRAPCYYLSSSPSSFLWTISATGAVTPSSGAFRHPRPPCYHLSSMWPSSCGPLPRQVLAGVSQKPRTVGSMSLVVGSTYPVHASTFVEFLPKRYPSLGFHKVKTRSPGLTDSVAV
jgi:hypothetical protein